MAKQRQQPEKDVKGDLHCMLRQVHNLSSFYKVERKWIAQTRFELLSELVNKPETQETPSCSETDSSSDELGDDSDSMSTVSSRSEVEQESENDVKESAGSLLGAELKRKLIVMNQEQCLHLRKTAKMHILRLYEDFLLLRGASCDGLAVMLENALQVDGEEAETVGT